MILPGLFCKTDAMCVLLSVSLCFLGYLVCLKLIYNTWTRRWPSSSGCVLHSPGQDRSGVPRARTRDSLGEVRALLVTAHPDDECMFFAPAVLKLTASKATVRLLCLSSGNYYNQGARRKQELLGSCAVLGIPAHQVTIIENKELQDDPKAEWSIALTAPLILKHITTYSINLAIKALIKSPSMEDLHKQTTTNKWAKRASAVTKQLWFDISPSMYRLVSSCARCYEVSPKFKPPVKYL
ncbi:N-acetylglucosaminyl-phosphatidylinositol de-N-acetylase isoform X3 [Silurus meridionalis]|uniref:N-acetylglucosaminyl-phosphatidylinositol de-N-acetylase isoform X3 n=1 Tax=Silurus meridionalis TaxID=175797 RepID=UPI001EEA8045|nr:N-acetylglucosaminyl-phosphatidylinositol de-N-acetylase isoform X3 [Silurus meridionalis]